MDIKVLKINEQLINMELKPCPFCGSDKHIDYYQSEKWYNEPFAYVNCRKCDATVRVNGDRGAINLLYNAVKIWNRREGE